MCTLYYLPSGKLLQLSSLALITLLTLEIKKENRPRMITSEEKGVFFVCLFVLHVARLQAGKCFASFQLSTKFPFSFQGTS